MMRHQQTGMITDPEEIEEEEYEEEEIDMLLHPDDDYFTWDDETGEEVY